MLDSRENECSGTFRNTAGTLPASSVPPPLKGCGTEHSEGRYGFPPQNGEQNGGRGLAHVGGTHTLYRFYSADGTLLYVGITGSPPQRFRAHSKTKEWWHRISDVKLVHFEDRAALIDAERDAIKSEHPLHNIVHNKKLQQNETPSQREERRWHHLIGQLEELQFQTGIGCAAVWHHVNRGEYEPARERLDTLLSEMAWFGSAAAEELIAASYHSGGSGPCTCGKQVLYFRTSDRYIHSDGTDSCFQPRWLQ